MLFRSMFDRETGTLWSQIDGRRPRDSRRGPDVAYFCHVNRLVLATGLSLEPGFEVTCRPE